MTGPERDRAYLRTMLLVGAAGGVGATFRYGMDLLIASSPLAVLLSNTLGCLLLGVLMASVSPEHRRMRAVVGGGFIGSLTTYSALATFTLEQELTMGIGYLLLTYVLGFSVLWIAHESVSRRRTAWS